MSNNIRPFQAVILAGGRGTRLLEETVSTPKPMLRIGDKTLLEHIMDIYVAQGIKEFIIPVGYKKEYIFDYFRNRFDITYIDNGTSLTGQFNRTIVSIVDTGEDTLTGGRIKRLQPRINAPFFLTYGDGLANVDLNYLLAVHDVTKADVTLTAVHPLPRFGAVKFYDEHSYLIGEFGEKQDNFGWVNGGFMVCEPAVFNQIDGDDTNFESDVLPYLASMNCLAGYRHDGFWHCVDTARDLKYIREMSDEGYNEWMNIFGTAKKF